MSGWQEARRILAVRLDNTGDVVMLGPALRAVKGASPEARITLLASPAGAAAAALLPWIDETIVWRSTWQDLGHLPFDPERELELVAILRQRAFDAALIFTSFSQSPHPPALVCYLAGISLRAGESKEFGGALLTEWVQGTLEDAHQVDRNLRLVETAGFPVMDRSLEIAIPDEAREEARTTLAANGLDPAHPYVLLHPGASAEARRYPAARWGAVARALVAAGWPVVITGVEREAAIARETADAAGPGATLLLGATGLPGYAALVDGASLVLCGNTLPMHLADATRTPALVMYSGTDRESQWAPRATQARLLRRPTPCAPCYRFSCPLELACLDFTPEEVTQVALAMLADSHAVQPGATPVALLPERPRIAVFQALGLGDLLCLTPALRALRTRFPSAHVTMIGAAWARETMLRSGLVDEFVPFPGWPGINESPAANEANQTTLARLLNQTFDVVFQMHGSGEISNGFAAALGAPITIGHGAARDNRLSHAAPWDESTAEPVRWLRLVDLLLAAGDPVNANRRDDLLEAPLRPEFRISEDEHAAAARLIDQMDPARGPLVVLHPGASDPDRRWPTSNFAEVANGLWESNEARIVLTGTGDEGDLARAIQEQCTAPVLDLTGKTTIGIFAAIIAAADLLVTNDTGAAHLAAATETPSVTLFGPANVDRWAPWNPTRHRAIDAKALFPALAPRDALVALPIDLVIEAAMTVLATQTRNAIPLAARRATPGWRRACAG